MNERTQDYTPFWMSVFPYLCCLLCTAHRLHDQQPRGKAHQQADAEPVHNPQHLEGPMVWSGRQSDAP